MGLFGSKKSSNAGYGQQPPSFTQRVANGVGRATGAANTVANVAGAGAAAVGGMVDRRKAADLEARLAQQATLLSPLGQEVDYLQNEASIQRSNIEYGRMELQQLQAQLAQVNQELVAKRKRVIDLDEQMIFEEIGLFRPQFDFANSTQYADKLKWCRDAQKQHVKKNTAVVSQSNWNINGDQKAGKKMVESISKLLLRAFNGECDDAVRKVKYSNLDASLDRIHKSAMSINQLGAVMGIGVTNAYVELKRMEVQLAFEFALKKQEEKEALREERERQREEAKLKKEIEEARKKLQKEQTQYGKALSDVEKQLATCADDERAALESKRNELIANLQEVNKGIADVDYREANQKAGYVYVISNLGSFGPNVYKIGMTRRLEPMERIHELGDASVPFEFDVHALIFTKDAPGLEAALHNRFADRKVNLVNTRREFFRCSLEEIVEAVKTCYDETVEFEMVPDAQQFRMSEKMRAAGQTTV